MAANRCPNPKCEYFNRTLPHNARVCPWCETPLGNVIPNTSQPPQQPISQSIPQQITPPYTDPTVNDQTNYQVRSPKQPIQQPYPPQTRLPLLKLIHFSGRAFQWSGEAGFIGRRSQKSPIPPEIDLTGIPDEGIVSRRHGRLSWDWSQNSYMITDMSTNGIYLNGTSLSPGVPYRITNGDSLIFGQDNLVRFTVYVV
jgi:pSer/pThr/pTyr-binding forkhead associated (FHA) protein